MKLKYFLAIASFLFSFLGVAVIVGGLTLVFFPPQGFFPAPGVRDSVEASEIDVVSRNIPGILLGLWAGIHAAHVSLHQNEKRRNKD